MVDDSLPTSTRRQRSALWTGLYLRFFDGDSEDSEPTAPTTAPLTDDAE